MAANIAIVDSFEASITDSLKDSIHNLDVQILVENTKDAMVSFPC